MTREGFNRMTAFIDDLIDCLVLSEETNNPNLVFSMFSEEDIWISSHLVLEKKDESNDPALIFTRLIASQYSKIKDKDSANSFLLYILQITQDDLIFEAAEGALVKFSSEIDDKLLISFHRTLETRYIDAIESNRTFIAIKALEGAVMLSILNGNDSLLLRSVSLLLNDFPAQPTDPDDPAYLCVKAIKLLGRCFDKRPDIKDIYAKVESRIDCDNYAINNEIQFNLGLMLLYDAFRELNQEELIAKFKKSRDYFIQAANCDDRSDAYFFSEITKFYIAYFEENLTGCTFALTSAKEYLIERMMLVDPMQSPYSNEFEENLYKIIFSLERWITILSHATEWPNIKPPLSNLANAYKLIREMEICEGITNSAVNLSLNYVMLPSIQSQLFRVQNIVSKLSEVLSDQEWRDDTSDSEIMFYELLLEEIQRTPIPKDLTAADQSRIRAAVAQTKPWFLKEFDELLNSGKTDNEVLIILSESILEEKELWGISDDQVANRISRNIISSLYEYLKWDIRDRSNKLRMIGLIHCVKIVAKYFRMLFTANREKEFLFLFAKPSGSGENATETDLQNHFYSSQRWQERVSVEKQPNNTTPGRPDLAFRCAENYLFPVEVKRESEDISRENIHNKYVTQTQSYGSSQNQVSFLFVLDVTHKELGTPLSDIENYCYIDGISTNRDGIQDYSIVFIFPANRYSPSEHSWKKTRKS